MSDSPERDRDNPAQRIAERIGAKEERKLKGKEKERQSIWFGLGMFGMVGWSVAIPTVIGIAVGVWLDAEFPGRISWTLTGLFVGVAVGALVAWNWVEKEGRPD